LPCLSSAAHPCARCCARENCSGHRTGSVARAVATSRRSVRLVFPASRLSGPSNRLVLIGFPVAVLLSWRPHEPKHRQPGRCHLRRWPAGCLPCRRHLSTLPPHRGAQSPTGRRKKFMILSLRSAGALVSLGFWFLLLATPGLAQVGNSGSLEGVVNDPSGSAGANATVDVSNPVSGFRREVTTGTDGAFRVTNVPFNPYHLVVTAAGFASYADDVEVRSGVPTTVQIALKIGTANTSVTVEASGSDLVENESTFHTDVDRGLFERLPLESASSSVTSLITLTSPGVAADSNGNMHGLGDHAQNSFSVDGQPITDQTSKVFSNQIPVDSIQSLEVISGAPPAEFGDKTSLVIKVTTKSGLGVTRPTGSITTSYGSFGTANAGFDLAYGDQKWGNFI